SGDILALMVRPEEVDPLAGAIGSRSCRVELAGESPVRVSAGAPGSRPQVTGEILWPERGVESLRE
ncbi:MAG: hypothetical protein QF848_15650, partial [Planctomycetota bacterium]|nr:hypothetical protein [Planctomycetota bacterium]